MNLLRRTAPDNWITTQTSTDNPTTLGDHIRKRRLDLHLLQSNAFKLIGAYRTSIQTWERSLGQPVIKHPPAIIALLGYGLSAIPTMFPEKLISSATSQD